MSFLTSRTTFLRSALPLAARSTPRAFSLSARQLSLNEDRTNDPNREADVDHHKHDSLNKQKSDQGHWKGELASNSEQIVKADREEIDPTSDNIKDLQKQGEQLGKKKQ